MITPAALKFVRQLHNYVGLFFAPTILFFAITGGLQMFGLHESSRGSSYVPPSILVHLAQLHKKGTVFVTLRRQPPSPVAKTDQAKPALTQTPEQGKAPESQAAGRRPNPLPMKIFFAATALALVTSTCTGIVLGWKYARSKMSVVAILAGGVVVPLLLLLV